MAEEKDERGALLASIALHLALEAGRLPPREAPPGAARTPGQASRPPRRDG